MRKTTELRSVLQSLISHWQLSAKAYTAYMENGKTFRYAQQLKLHNTAAKDLLAHHLDVIPAGLQSDALAIIEHYTIWSAKWDDWKDKLDPAPDDVFAFENDHRFPKDAARRLEAALDDL